MKIKKVDIVPGCISCGSCEFICPQVFEVKDIATVRLDAQILKHEALVDEAAEMCPVNVIKVTKE